jgi:hypothetical protein
MMETLPIISRELLEKAIKHLKFGYGLLQNIPSNHTRSHSISLVLYDFTLGERNLNLQLEFHHQHNVDDYYISHSEVNPEGVCNIFAIKASLVDTITLWNEILEFSYNPQMFDEKVRNLISSYSQNEGFIKLEVYDV